MSNFYPVLADYAHEYTILTRQLHHIQTTLLDAPHSPENYRQVKFLIDFLVKRTSELDGYIKDTCKAILKDTAR